MVMTWWCHQMETFSTLLALCAGNSLVTGEFPTQRPVTQSFGVFFDLRLNKRLSKKSWGWWFETPSCSLWCYCNEDKIVSQMKKREFPNAVPLPPCQLRSRRWRDDEATPLGGISTTWGAKSPRPKSRWHGSCPRGVAFQQDPTTITSTTPKPTKMWKRM